MESPSFRWFAHRLVDWMADYLDGVETLPIQPEILPGSIRAQLPSSPPSQGEDFSAIWQDFQTAIMPGMSHWNHPGWFAYFPANTSPPSILAEMLTATLGAQCMSWATSPAATELEQVVLDWLRQALALPKDFVGSLQDTASSSTLVALLAAREAATQGGFGQAGASHPQASLLRVYTSEEAHSSVEKAVKLAGFGQEFLRKIPTDEAFALRPESLRASLEADRKAGLRPACVIATVGTTSSTAIDPLPAIAALCKEFGAWLHIDAAYAGAAAIVPEIRPWFAGIEEADSLVFNPHKWLLTNFDCSALYVRSPHALLQTFQITPEYLKTTHDPEVVNFRDWGIPLGRRFRALKLWFVLRSYGISGLQEILRRHIALAQTFRSWLEAHPAFEILAPSPFGLVCFRYRPPDLDPDDPRLDALNQTLLQQINASRQVFLTSTRLRGRFCLRLSVGQRTTALPHLRSVWTALQDALPYLHHDPALPTTAWLDRPRLSSQDAPTSQDDPIPHRGDLRMFLPSYISQTHTKERTLLLVHGFPLDGSLWDEQLRLASQHFRIIIPDLPGFGHSLLSSDLPPSLDRYTDSLLALLDHLQLPHVILGGLSMGGYVALHFARKHPERLHGLLLSHTRAEADTPEVRESRAASIARIQKDGLAWLADEMPPRLLGDPSSSLSKRLHSMILRQRPEGVIYALQAMASRLDSTDLLASIRIPTLVIGGEEDKLTPPSVLASLSASIPRSRLAILPHAGHLSPIEQPSAFASQVLSFFGS